MKARNKTKFVFFVSLLTLNFLNCPLFSSAASLLSLEPVYYLGEMVNITLSGNIGSDISLEIRTEDSSYRFVDILDNIVRFVPQKSGSYSVFVINKTDKVVIDSFSFNVLGEDTVEYNNQINPTSFDFSIIKNIIVRNSKNKRIRFSLRRIDHLEKKERRLRLDSVIVGVTGKKNKGEDIEILVDDMPVKRILFSNLVLDDGSVLGLDRPTGKIKKIHNQDVVEVYAIDPSRLDFYDATVIAKAKGSMLYKCALWDFYEQRCYGEWKAFKRVIPGEEYSFRLTKNDPAFGETNPPEPHNVIGRIFNLDGSGVENGIPVTINDTASGDFVLTYTYAPPVPSLKGSYSATINGSDGDTIVVTAWNKTYYGTNTTILAATTTYANVILNTTRPSEVNVTILSPSNDSLFNTTPDFFSVVANITIIGGKDGVACNATIAFSDSSILAVASDESTVHKLGNISLGDSNVTRWNVTIVGIGSSNISVRAECINQTKNFEHLDIDYVYNITTIDTSPPVITLISPKNNTFVGNNVSFFYNVSDYSEIANCSLIINGSVVANNSDIKRNTLQNFNLSLGIGSYWYYINCTDNSSNKNIGSSESRFFNVSDKDLTLFSSDIVFSNENPVDRETIRINATIHNIGSENITKSFIVQFFEGEPQNKDQIGENITIDGLNSSSNITVGVDWTAKRGVYNIHVAVDAPLETNGSIREINESNNQANRTIFIPAYNVYFGNITFDVLLASASSHSIFMWFNETEISGNIFFVDSDSNVEWGSLMALGINVSGKNSTNDFAEVDEALNLTGLPDSITSIFAYNGLARNTDNFLVFGSNITNVPIVNSTNNSNFITGILWDMSDDTNGEYNGSEDIVFVTKINPDKQGAYGVYDYEIRVPANLVAYLEPNNKDSVTLYVELD